MKWLKWGGLVLGIILMTLSFINASWLAPDPIGKAKIVADRGVYQSFPREGLGPDDCTAIRINEPAHPYLENTALAARAAERAGADVIGFDSARTKDGKVMAFRDRDLDCRTDGAGPLRNKTLEQLKELDIGYGYTADGGKTYPFRGRHVGAMPTIFEAVADVRHKDLFFRISSRDPKEADALIAGLKEAGVPLDKGTIFMGPKEPMARIRKLAPEAVIIDHDAAEQCTSDYKLQGWIGMTPQSCNGAALIIPVNRQWTFAGWPARAIARMDSVGAKIMLTGPASDAPIYGLTQREQVGDIPVNFNGYVLVDNVEDIAPVMP